MTQPVASMGNNRIGMESTIMTIDKALTDGGGE